MLFPANAVLLPVYIYSEYTLVVGNTPYGKRRISRNEPAYGKLDILD